MSKNILITKTLLYNNPSVQYFKTEINDNIFYSDCYIPGEEGVKAILAKEHVDHILLLYSSDDNVSIISNRLANYVNNNSEDSVLDKYLNVIGSNNAEKVNAFVDSYINERLVNDNLEKNIVKELIQYNNTQELFSVMSDSCSGLELSDDVKNYTKLYIYKHLPDKYKMFCREDNESVSIENVDIGSYSNINFTDFIIQLKTSILSLLEEGEEANLIFYDYATKPSFNYTLLNILKMLAEQNNAFKVARHYGMSINDGNLCIEEETNQYMIGLLADGMSAFTEYGKVDKILSLITLGNITNNAVISLVYAMRTIDSGISLCDIDAIIDGINDIKAIISKKHSFDNKESQIFYNFIKESIVDSYAKLLEGETIDYFELVKWAISKKLYQQALTIVEAKMPEAFVNNGVFYFYDETSIEDDLIEKFAAEYSYLKPYESYKMEYLDHYFIKTYLRDKNKKCKTEYETQKHFAELKVSTINTDDDTIIKAYTKCNDFVALEDALFGYYYIGHVRNKTNHAETRKTVKTELVHDVTKETEKMTMVLEALNYFVDKYEAVLTKLDNSDYTRRDINYSRMKTRAGELKDERYNKKK